MFLNIHAVVLMALCSVLPVSAYYYRVRVSNGRTWGSWGSTETCPSGSYAVGFKIQVERNQYGGDDTAMNSIRLYCYENGRYRGTVTSKEGRWGSWTSQRRCSAGAFTAYQLRVEGNQGSGDDTAVNNIRFRCSSGQILTGHGMSWGSWGSWSSPCSGGGKICGLRTSVEPKQGWRDDTALNDVNFVCCV